MHPALPLPTLNSPWLLHWGLHTHFSARPAALWAVCLEHALLLSLAVIFAYYAPSAAALRALDESALTAAQGTAIPALLLCALALWANWRWRPFSGPALLLRHHARGFAYALTGLLVLRNLLAWQLARGSVQQRVSAPTAPSSAYQATLGLAVQVFTVGLACAVIVLLVLVCGAMVRGAALELGVASSSSSPGVAAGAAPAPAAGEAAQLAFAASPAPTSSKSKRGSSRSASRSSKRALAAAEGWTSNPAAGAPAPTTPAALAVANLHTFPLKMLQSLEERGVFIQASGRVIKTRPTVALSPYEEALAEELAVMVRAGHALEGGMLHPLSPAGAGGVLGGVVGAAALPQLRLLGLSGVGGTGDSSRGTGASGGGTAESSVAPSPGPRAGKGSAPADAAAAAAAAAVRSPLVGVITAELPGGLSPTQLPAALTASAARRAPTMPTLALPPHLSPPATATATSSAGFPCTDRVIEGGQVYYLDGPGGPALAPGWQRYTTHAPDVGEEAAMGHVWYVCVVPPYKTDSPPAPQWEPPYADIPDAPGTRIPFHPRIDPRDGFVVTEEGGRHYYDPASKELLKEGWRAVHDGVDMWYGHRIIKGGLWDAPLLNAEKKGGKRK